MDNRTILERLAQRHRIEKLNPMQQQMAATDATRMVLLSPTGSGKTVAFAIRLLRSLTPSTGNVQAVVMAPSRELVIQIADVIRPLAQGLKTVAFYGGHAMADEVNSMKVVPDIIVATPGRLLDHLRRGTVMLADVSALVLDEYDKSLELGFHDEMKRIVKQMRHLSLIILTSATPLAEMPGFLSFARPETFDFTASKPTGGHVQFVRVDSPERDKLSTLEALLRSLPNSRALVFVNHRESAERVYNELRRAGFPVGLYHGGLEQRERKLAVDLLDNGTTPVLIATDLGARGLDIDNVQYVIHYHLPLTIESWTHRNGRTARMGADGTVFSIIADGENIPEYVVWDRPLSPRGEAADPIRSDTATIYINAGKKEKISRGDIAGYLIHRGGLRPDEVGRITLDDHSALVAVPRAALGPLASGATDEIPAEAAVLPLLERLAPHRLKNTRVRLSLIK